MTARVAAAVDPRNIAQRVMEVNFRSVECGPYHAPSMLSLRAMSSLLS